MRLTLGILAATLLLVGCGAGNLRPSPAAFDFGPAGAAPAGGLPVAAVEVSAPSWLAGSAMQYRLLYRDPARRGSYRESRWAAPPAELLEQALARRLGAGAGGCRLEIELDELVQVFDIEKKSRLLLEGRAVLFAGRELVAQRAFALARPAPTADARGGVAAAGAAVAALGDELAGWLAAHAERCRG